MLLSRRLVLGPAVGCISGSQLFLHGIRSTRRTVRYFSSTAVLHRRDTPADGSNGNPREDPALSKAFSTSEFKRLAALAKPEAKPLAGAVGLLGVSAAITMSVPFSMGRIIDLVTTATPASIDVLWQIGGGLAAIFTVGAMANFGRVLLMRTASERIITNVRKDLFGTIVKQEIAFFDKNRTGELINRLSSDTTVVGKALTTNLSDGLRAVISALAGGSMMLYVSPKLTLIMLTILPPIALAATFYGRYIKRLSKRTQDALSSATKVAEERLSNIRTVRAFAQEGAERERYGAEVENVFQLARKDALASALFFGGMGFVANTMVISVLLLGGSMVMSSEITVGALTSFLLYTGYVGSSVSGMTSFYSEIQKGIGATYRIFELLERQTQVPLTGGKILDTLDGRIKFEGVSFVYPSRPDTTVFDNLSLEVGAGSAIAVVGESGSGKSTIGSLLLRFYDPDKGRISVDDVDIKELDPKWLRNQIGIVSQEPALFAATISENISYGNPNATLDDVKWAAERANASKFIEKFSNGYDTYVGERGIALSGGQKQRIAIARAILKNPKILILDEATSALDAESELQVQEALERLMKGRTVITIAHRLSTIKAANYVAVIGNGKVAEFGPPETLLTNDKGHFRRLMDRQMGLKASSPDPEIPARE